MKKFLAIFAVIALMAFAAPAFAANPFMDVPAGHWAYDAVDQLAARGIVSGYPDGAFKGAQPATRYEVASVVARALAHLDATKASKEDLEMLKKLVMEFKDELDALGVKVDQLDKRVAVLEKNIGGWKLNGEFRFDAKFTGGDGVWEDDNYFPVFYRLLPDSDEEYRNYINPYGFGNDRDRQFKVDRYRLHFTKFIDEKTTFYGRLVGQKAEWDRYYVDTILPYDIQFRVGLFNFDWEDDAGLYVDNDATFGDWTVTGVQFKKDFGMFGFTGIVARDVDFIDGVIKYLPMDRPTPPPFVVKEDKMNYSNAHMLYAARLHADFSEKFRAGVMAYWLDGDQDITGTITFNNPSQPPLGYRAAAPDVTTYGVYAGFDFTPNVTLQGVYYWQNLDVPAEWGEFNDSPESWKAQLIIKQDLLKFTSLWLEYGQEDNTFLGYNLTGDTFNMYGASPTANRLFADPRRTSKYFFIRADQKWNDKWSTFERFYKVDLDTRRLDDTTNWTVGVKYQYTPAMSFELAYDNIDYGNDGGGMFFPGSIRRGSDHLIRFRTFVTF